MSAIIIKADNQSKKILKELAERLGASVTLVNDEQYEDFMMGTLIEKSKTNITVSRETIFKKLRKK